MFKIFKPIHKFPLELQKINDEFYYKFNKIYLDTIERMIKMRLKFYEKIKDDMQNSSIIKSITDFDNITYKLCYFQIIDDIGDKNIEFFYLKSSDIKDKKYDDKYMITSVVFSYCVDVSGVFFFRLIFFCYFFLVCLVFFYFLLV